MTNLMLYGPSCSGKSTLAKLLEPYGYKHLPTGEMTRYLYSLGCTNMPTVMTTIIETLKPANYCFDHFYMHTAVQLRTITGKWPVIITLIDKREEPTLHSQDPEKIKRKRARFDAQSAEISKFIIDNKLPVVNVTHLATGFDVSELIEHKLISYDAPTVLGVQLNVR